MICQYATQLPRCNVHWYTLCWTKRNKRNRKLVRINWIGINGELKWFPGSVTSLQSCVSTYSKQWGENKGKFRKCCHRNILSSWNRSGLYRRVFFLNYKNQVCCCTCQIQFMLFVLNFFIINGRTHMKCSVDSFLAISFQYLERRFSVGVRIVGCIFFILEYVSWSYFSIFFLALVMSCEVNCQCSIFYSSHPATMSA